MSEDVTIRAARAEQLLADEVLQEAFTAQFGTVLARLLRADLRDNVECVAVVASLQASQGFKEELQGFITAGKAAERKPFKVA